MCAYAVSMDMLVLAGAATNNFTVELRTLCQNPQFKQYGLADKLIVRMYPEFVSNAARSHVKKKLWEIYIAETKPVKDLEDMAPPFNA